MAAIAPPCPVATLTVLIRQEKRPCPRQCKQPERTGTKSHLPQVTEPRNPGMPLEYGIGARRAGKHLCGRGVVPLALPARRSVKKTIKAAWAAARPVSCNRSNDAIGR